MGKGASAPQATATNNQVYYDSGKNSYYTQNDMGGKGGGNGGFMAPMLRQLGAGAGGDGRSYINMPGQNNNSMSSYTAPQFQQQQNPYTAMYSQQQQYSNPYANTQFGQMPGQNMYSRYNQPQNPYQPQQQQFSQPQNPYQPQNYYQGPFQQGGMGGKGGMQGGGMFGGQQQNPYADMMTLHTPDHYKNMQGLQGPQGQPAPPAQNQAQLNQMSQQLRGQLSNRGMGSMGGKGGGKGMG
jgi:hypothetical protein